MHASIPHNRAKLLAILAMALFALALVACGPEANRTDLDGAKSGADIGNWGDPVQIHGNEGREQSIYYKTPDELPAE